MSRKLASGLSQPAAIISGGRVVSSPRDVPGGLSMVGHSGCASSGIQWETGQICVQDHAYSGVCSGYIGDTIGPVLPCLCLPSATATSMDTSQNLSGRSSGNSGCPGLAPERVVLWHQEHVSGQPLDSPRPSGPPVTRSNLPPFFMVTGFNGMTIESRVLKEKWVFNFIIPTLSRVRKATLSKICRRIWKSYIIWCEENRSHHWKYVVCHILAFFSKKELTCGWPWVST